MGESGRLLIAIDAGGTMTDVFICDDAGKFTIGKALTNKVDESISYLEGVKDACSYWDLKDDEEVHKLTLVDIYTGTLMLNTLLERKGDKVGLIVTKGQESMYIHERGHTWLGYGWEDILHHKTHRHVGTEMFKLNRKLVKGVAERIASGSYFYVTMPGSVEVPLNEDEVRKAVNELLDEGVKAIGIVFMFSYIVRVAKMDDGTNIIAWIDGNLESLKPDIKVRLVIHPDRDPIYSLQVVNEDELYIQNSQRASRAQTLLPISEHEG